MDMVGGIAAAHVKRGVGALGAHHSEACEKLLHHVKVGSPEPTVSDVGCLDPCHAVILTNEASAKIAQTDHVVI
jgi:hypothetical protein